MTGTGAKIGDTQVGLLYLKKIKIEQNMQEKHYAY